MLYSVACGVMVDPPAKTMAPTGGSRPRLWKRQSAALPPSSVPSAIPKAVVVQSVVGLAAPARACESATVSADIAKNSTATVPAATKPTCFLATDVEAQAGSNGNPVATVPGAAFGTTATILGGGKPFSLSAVQQRNLALYVVAKSRLLAKDKEERESGSGTGTAESVET